GRNQEREDWARLQPWTVVPALQEIPSVKNLGRAVWGLAAVVAVSAVLWASNTTAVTLVSIVAFSLIGLSVGVITGLSGQLSLGQFAVAGIAAATSVVVDLHTHDLLIALVAAAAVAAVTSVILGLPALRV